MEDIAGWNASFWSAMSGRSGYFLLGNGGSGRGLIAGCVLVNGGRKELRQGG